jgi:hypothetical protein
VWWFSPLPSEAKEDRRPVLLYREEGRRRRRAGIGENHHTPDMVGPVKSLPLRFFILFSFFPAWAMLLRAVKATSDFEGVATVDQPDMRGLVTA